LHSSWDNVANSVKEIILKYAKNWIIISLLSSLIYSSP
jgi:hypothetical protein